MTPVLTRSERQKLAIERWKQNKCRGTIVAATGFGKTKTAIDAIERVLVKNPNITIIIVVPTIILKGQWEEKLEKARLGDNVKTLVLNTAAKHYFYCNMLIIDEIHKAAADQMSEMFLNCNPRFILGLTATYERLDGKEKLIDKYAPVCDTVTIEEATKNGWLSPYKEYKVLLNVDLSEYDKANKTFLSAFSFFNFDWNTAMAAVTNVREQQKIAKAYNCDLKQVKANAYSFNRSLQFRKHFIANHPKKFEIAKKILEARKDMKCITFNTSIKGCKSYGNGYIIHSQKKTAENKQVIEEFNKCDSGVLHTSKMANEGLDIAGLSVAVITGFNSSKTTKIQQVGRVIRKEEGKEAEIFTLVLKGTVEEKWFAKAEEGMDFIDITEDELDLVLANSPISNTTKTQTKTVGFRF